MGRVGYFGRRGTGPLFLVKNYKLKCIIGSPEE